MTGTILKFPVGDHVEIRGVRIAGLLAWRPVVVSSVADLDDLEGEAYATRSAAVAASRRMFSLPIVFDDGADLSTIRCEP